MESIVSFIPPEKTPTASFMAHHDSIDFIRANEHASAPQLLSASHDDSVKIWDITRREVVKTIEAHRQGVYCIDVSPSGGQFASCSPDQTVALWDARSGAEVSRGTSHTYKVYFVYYASDNQLISCGRDKNIFQWDTRNMSAPAKSYAQEDSGTFRSVAVSPDKEVLIATTAESCIEGYSFNGGERLFNHKVDYDISVFPADKEWFILPESIYCGRFFNNDPKELISVHQDLAIRRFRCEGGELRPTETKRNHFDFVRHVEIASDDSIYVTTCQDGSVRVWNASDNTPIFSLVGHTQIVSCAVLLSDQKTVITSSYDQTIKFFSLN